MRTAKNLPRIIKIDANRSKRWGTGTCVIAAHSAVESKNQTSATPFWRTLKSKGELNLKYLGGIAGLKKPLSAEGHKVIQKGKRFFVAEFDAALVALKDRKKA